jgi:hypothetical protein
MIDNSSKGVTKAIYETTWEPRFNFFNKVRHQAVCAVDTQLIADSEYAC